MLLERNKSRPSTILLISFLVSFLCLFAFYNCQSVSSVSRCQISHDDTYHGLYINCHDKGLTEIPQDFPNDTTSIDLSDNQINAVTRGSFSSLYNLRLLNLESNSISRIEQLAFSLCSKLHILLIKDNQMCRHVYSSDVFAGLDNVIKLSIDSCVNRRTLKPFQMLHCITLNIVGDLNFKGFQCLNNLRCISLTGDVNLRNGTFREIMNMTIETVKVNCPTLSILETGTFTPLLYLQELSLAHSLRGLHKVLSAMYGLVGRNITRLDLRKVASSAEYQNEKEIEEQLLTKEHMKYLLQICVKNLTLSHNRIQYVDLVSIEKSLLGKCLVSLDMSKNFIMRVSFVYVVFLPLFSNLMYADFSNQYMSLPIASSAHNYLYQSPPMIISPYNQSMLSLNEPKNITMDDILFSILDAFQSKISVTIPPLLRVLNSSRISTNAGHGHIDQHKPCTVINGGNLITADLSYNGIPALPSIKGLRNIKYVDLSGNYNIQLPDDFFDHMSSLEHLKLRDQSLLQPYVTLQGKRFLKSLPRLKSLYIGGNRLVQLPINLFEVNQFLEYLDLSNNVFITIPVDLLLSPQLLVLDMSSNSLGSLDGPTRHHVDAHFDISNHSFQLNLYGNFFSCSCGNYDFLFWLKETDVFNDVRKNFSCLTQSGVIIETRNITVNFLHFWRQCTGKTLLSVSVVLLTFLIYSVLLALLVVKNRTKLANFFIYAIKYHIPRPRRRDFRTDLYVSYAEADYRWVCHELCPALEDRNLTLYIWDRDSVPGDSIPDQIAENIPQCWKTILYFTDNYERDPWSYMSMMAAINCVDNLNPERLVLLLPEDNHVQIPDCLLDVVPESCIFHVADHVDRYDQLWGEITHLVKKRQD